MWCGGALSGLDVLVVSRSPCGVKVLSVGSMLPSGDAAVALRGPRKTHLVRSMLRDTLWGRLGYLVIDTPPGGSHW